MKKVYPLIFFCAFHLSSFAGNVAGGDISYQCISGNTIQFTLTVWGDYFSPNDTFRISFGDNSSANYTNQSAISFTNLAPTYPNYSEIKWVFSHTYAGPGTYDLSAIFSQRDSGIVNIPNSCNTKLSLFTDLILDPTIGCNSSPICSNSNLIELLSVSTNFNSNLGPVDPDGDSLSFSLQPSSDSGAAISGYSFPNFIGGGLLGINAITGDYYWNAPQYWGRYNIVIAIEQWKLFPNNQRYLIATTSREIQLFVGTLSGITEQNSASFSCFPNPISLNNELHLQFEKEGNYFMQLFNSEGKIVFENSIFCATQQSIKLPTLISGIYFVNISDNDHLISTQKILIPNP